MSQELLYRPADATDDGMHDGEETEIGCQNVGSV